MACRARVLKDMGDSTGTTDVARFAVVRSKRSRIAPGCHRSPTRSPLEIAMQEVVIESVEIVTAEELSQPAMLSDLEVELLDKVGGGQLSWAY